MACTDGYNSPDAVTTTYEYEERGLLDKVHVAGVMVDDLDYDVAGNRKQISDASSGVTTFTFDALGQTETMTDAKGQVTRYEYDLLGRLTDRIEDYGGPDQLTNSWRYDTQANGIGRPASRSNPYMTESLSYDGVGRLKARNITISVPGYPGNGNRQISYGYDPVKGLPTTVSYPAEPSVPSTALGFEQTYTWHGLPKMTKVAGGGFLEQIVSMNAYGQPTELFFQNAVTTTRTYDESGLVESISSIDNTGSPITLQDLSYQWNDDGTLHQRTKGSTSETFGYDALGRLTQAVTSGSVSRTKSYSYDEFGNLRSKTSDVFGDHSLSLGYVYGSPYRLSGSSDDATYWFSTGYSYDANGNITSYDR